MERSKSSFVHCIRYALVFLHVYFLVVGALLLTLCVWVLELPGTNHAIAITTSDLSQNQIDRLCFVSIAVGALVCLVSLLGFCGLMNNDKYIFFIKGVLMIALLVAEIVVGIFAVLLQEKIRAEMLPQLSRSLSLYNGDLSNDTISIGWRETQRSFSCCGITTELGYENHTNVEYYDEESNITFIGSNWYRRIGNDSNKEWPESCCKVNSDGVVSDITACYDESGTDLNKQGCHPEVLDFLRNSLILFAIFCLLFVVFQIPGIFLSFRMFNYARKRKTKPQSF